MFRFLFICSPYVYMILIWILSSLPSDAIIDTGFSFDDLFKESLHLIEFGILYLLFALSLKLTNMLTLRSNVIIAGISILYGLVDELHQSFVPYRSATVIDFVKDTIGVLIAFYFVRRKLQKK